MYTVCMIVYLMCSLTSTDVYITCIYMSMYHIYIHFSCIQFCFLGGGGACLSVVHCFFAPCYVQILDECLLTPIEAGLRTPPNMGPTWERKYVSDMAELAVSN